MLFELSRPLQSVSVKTALTFRPVTAIEHKSYVTAEEKSFHFALDKGLPPQGNITGHTHKTESWDLLGIL